MAGTWTGLPSKGQKGLSSKVKETWGTSKGPIANTHKYPSEDRVRVPWRGSQEHLGPAAPMGAMKPSLLLRLGAGAGGSNGGFPGLGPSLFSITWVSA